MVAGGATRAQDPAYRPAPPLTLVARSADATYAPAFASRPASTARAELLARVVARSDQRARLDVCDAEGLARGRVRRELLRRDPAIDGQVRRRRLQVLTHRHDVDAGVAEVGEGRRDLVGPFAHPEDQVGLRDLSGAVALGEPQHVERPVVAERGPDPAMQPGHRLEVVREHRRRGVEHRREVALAALEVARQDLDVDARAPPRGTRGSSRPRPPPRRRPGRRARRR